ncbi:helix-turn-helix domain-containing protein [Kineosporia sp. J2-2]|uniref:Helix-turn-helix domain-containing protein n=1 Tax=Kineosporia corallincola TaxID=2835133 RepID=A0ABS5TCB4_9ACTN|nr:helix-turn-helix domain-containing protein [Kineosporia corallincola]MBT0768724.1 helix-turn-helix domain-containing protein [Kineosporia corallincola]
MVRKNPAIHQVVVLAVPDVVLLDLAIPAQIFGHRDEADRYRLTVCAERRGPVPTTTGGPLYAEAGLSALDRADTVVVPGYEPMDEPSPRTLAALRRAAARGARIMSVCTGAFALAAAGLLDGRPATTHWEDAAELAARYPQVLVDPDVLYIDDGQILTSAGVCAGIDLCLHVVRSDHGSEAAGRVARRLVVAPHRAGGQAQFIARQVPPQGKGLSATCVWAAERLSEPLTVADLARHSGYAVRTFSRRFLQENGMTPQQWLTRHRVAEARRLLEASDLPVGSIATRCGLGTATNLRIHLARDTGLTPSAYRAAYQGTG